MSDRFSALLVHSRRVPFDSLNSALKELDIATSSVSSLEEASQLIPQTEPHLIFTDTTLADGSWPDVINLTDRLGIPTSVIVVSPQTDIKLYWAVIERGGHDFLTPPFEHAWLELIVQRAADDARCRRLAPAPTVLARRLDPLKRREKGITTDRMLQTS